jgi:hypothetical protein
VLHVDEVDIDFTSGCDPDDAALLDEHGGELVPPLERSESLGGPGALRARGGHLETRQPPSIAWQTARVTAAVVAVPPRSGV